MRVLLTGASGFLGHHALTQLLIAQIDVVVVGRSCPVGYLGEYIEADLLQTNCLTDVIKRAEADHLLHLAWYVDHGTYWTSPLNFRWLDATVRLAEAFCLAGGKKMVLAGTCAEYDWSYTYCTEQNTPLIPGTIYGVAKDATRRLVMAVCAAHLVKCVWGRVFLPYGPGEDRRRLLPALMDVFDGKREPFGVSGRAFRDFLHVTDVARGFVVLLQEGVTGAFNICCGQPVQISEVVKLLAKSRNADPQLVLSLTPLRVSEPAILFGDNTKILQLGWRAVHNLGELSINKN